MSHNAAPVPDPHQAGPPPTDAGTVPIEQIQAQEQQLAQADPQLMQQLQQEDAMAQQTAQSDPQLSAQITQEEIAQLQQADPQLAQELVALKESQTGAPPSPAQPPQSTSTPSNPSTAPVDQTIDSAGQPVQGTAPTSHVIGDPNAEATQWTFQGANGYCAPNSISMLLEAATGQHLSEQQIASWAISNGEMTRLPPQDDPPGIPSLHYGMLPQQAADTINALGNQYGITATLQTGNLSDLENYLKGGREVMIEIDAQRIWHEPGTPDTGQPNNYVVVTGIDPSTNTVFLNDPGIPYGKEESVPLSDFQAAWSTSNNVMIVTSKGGSGGSQASSGGGVDEAVAGPVLLPVTLYR